MKIKAFDLCGWARRQRAKLVGIGSAAFHGGAANDPPPIMQSECTRPRAAVEGGATGISDLGPFCKGTTLQMSQPHRSKKFERLFLIENLEIELDVKNCNCVIVKFDNTLDCNKKSGDNAKSENAIDIHNHFVCYEFDYVQFVGSNPIHDPEPIVIGENRCRLERKRRDQSQFEFALAFLRLDSARKFGLANETATVNDVYLFKCDLKKG